MPNASNGWLKPLVGFIVGVILTILGQLFIAARTEGAIGAEVRTVERRVERLEDDFKDHDKEFKEILTSLARIEALLEKHLETHGVYP